MKNLLIFTTLTALALFSCDRTRSTTGWDYMPGMYYSKAYETFTPNPNFSDGLTMRTPAEGTVPREMVPFPWVKSDADRAEAGRVLVNPLEATPENIARGEEAYGIFCIHCHGVKGDGQGFLFTSKRYPYPPANLVSEKTKALKDGEIYHTITVGYGIMGPHGGMIRPEDRWKIILYLRENLQKQTD
jgi:mono/diheme cytochrome c family protein